MFDVDVISGMVGMIHDNRELPIIDTGSIYLSPTKRHKFAYKKKVNYFLPAPYSDCTEKVPPAMDAMFQRYQGADYAYSQTVCNILCTQSFV